MDWKAQKYDKLYVGFAGIKIMALEKEERPSHEQLIKATEHQ